MRTKVTATTVPKIPRSVPRAFRKAFLYRGLFSRVARQIGRGRNHVRRVALGERKSPEVESALLRAIEQIEEAA